MRNAGLDEVQAGIKIARRNINNLRHHACGRKRRRTKELLDESKRGEQKGWIKTQHSENQDTCGRFMLMYGKTNTIF